MHRHSCTAHKPPSSPIASCLPFTPVSAAASFEAVSKFLKQLLPLLLPAGRLSASPRMLQAAAAPHCSDCYTCSCHSPPCATPGGSPWAGWSPHDPCRRPRQSRSSPSCPDHTSIAEEAWQSVWGLYVDLDPWWCAGTREKKTAHWQLGIDFAHNSRPNVQRSPCPAVVPCRRAACLCPQAHRAEGSCGRPHGPAEPG